MRREPNHILQSALKYYLVGKKKPGRPCFTWKDTFEEEMSKLGLQSFLQEAEWFDKSEIVNKKREIFEADLSEESE